MPRRGDEDDTCSVATMEERCSGEIHSDGVKSIQLPRMEMTYLHAHLKWCVWYELLEWQRGVSLVVSVLPLSAMYTSSSCRLLICPDCSLFGRPIRGSHCGMGSQLM